MIYIFNKKKILDRKDNPIAKLFYKDIKISSQNFHEI